MYRPIPNVNQATKIRVREHFTTVMYFIKITRMGRGQQSEIGLALLKYEIFLVTIHVSYGSVAQICSRHS